MELTAWRTETVKLGAPCYSRGSLSRPVLQQRVPPEARVTAEGPSRGPCYSRGSLPRPVLQQRIPPEARVTAEDPSRGPCYSRGSLPRPVLQQRIPPDVLQQRIPPCSKAPSVETVPNSVAFHQQWWHLERKISKGRLKLVNNRSQK